MLIGDRSLSKVIYLPKNLQCQHMVCIIKKCETLIRPGAKAAEGRGSVGQRGNRDPTLPTASASIFSITASASIHIFNSSLNYLWVATHLHWSKYLMLSSDCEVHGPLLRKADQERRSSLQSRGVKTPSVNPLLRDSYVLKSSTLDQVGGVFTTVTATMVMVLVMEVMLVTDQWSGAVERRNSLTPAKRAQLEQWALQVPMSRS